MSVCCHRVLASKDQGQVTGHASASSTDPKWTPGGTSPVSLDLRVCISAALGDAQLSWSLSLRVCDMDTTCLAAVKGKPSEKF